MENKIILSDKRDPELSDTKHKIKIFSLREVKSNPFGYLDEESKRVMMIENEISLDYKIEMAMEYELIYNSHFFDQ